MKKIFSTVAMAIVAFTAVVSMSSCQNDDPSSFNAAPQVPQTTQTTQTNTQTTTQTSNKEDHSGYAYQATIPSEILTYFDVEITRVDGSKTTTFSFTKEGQIEGLAGAQTEKDAFNSNEDVVGYTAKVTPKANWKELVAANNLKRLPIGVSIDYEYRSIPANYSQNMQYFDVFTDKSMEKIVKLLSTLLTVKGAKTNGYIN